MKYYTKQDEFDDKTFDLWEAIRSRVGRRKRIPNLARKQAAKRSWKLGGSQSKRRRAIRRWHKSPPAKRLKRQLGRFNKKKRGGNSLGDSYDYEIVMPFALISMTEHLSWLISQENYELYEDVYEITDTITEIISCPNVLKDILEIGEK